MNKLSWNVSGDDEPMRTCYARMLGLTFVVEEHIDGASLCIVLDRGTYPNIYEAERGAESILNEIIKDARMAISAEDAK